MTPLSRAKTSYATGIRRAYQLGRSAARDGRTLDENPYRNPDHRLSWQDGFLAERMPLPSDAGSR